MNGLNLAKYFHKKRIFFYIALVILCFSLVIPIPTYAASESYGDTDSHWAKTAIDKWSDYEIVNGYNSSFRPDDSLTRAEMAAVISRLLGLGDLADNQFRDLGNTWYTEAVLKCLAEGILQGDGNLQIRPEDAVTREEAAVMLGRALGIAEAADGSKLFKDGNRISPWAQGYVNAMVREKILKGYDGFLSPAGHMSRAAVVTVLDNAITTYINQPGIYSGNINGMVIVTCNDVVFNQATISGNLIVAQGAKGASLSFKDTKVQGTIQINAAATEFLFEGSEIQVISAAAGGISMSVDAGTKVKEIILQITAQGTIVNVAQGASVDRVESSADGVVIKGQGSVSAVEVTGHNTAVDTSGTQLTLQKGSIGITCKGKLVFGNIITGSKSPGGSSRSSSPAEDNTADLAAMKEFTETDLGKQPPDSFVAMETFLQAAIPYITFEQGEDPAYIAQKQGYIKEKINGFACRDDILYPLIRMTYIDIPKNADLAQIALDNGIISENDKIKMKDNIQITAAVACKLISNARQSWYTRLEAEEPAQELELLYYYLSNSTYSYPGFTFSEDGKVLWYGVMGELKAINVSDLTPSGQVPASPGPQEEYPSKEGESVINYYDNAGVLRAVCIEAAKRRNFVTDKYILYRESAKEPWQRIVEFDLSLTRDYEIVGFTVDNKKMIVKTNFYDNYVTLYEVDPETMTREIIYQNPHADVAVELVAILAGIPVFGLKNPATGELLTAIYVDDKARLVCLNDDISAIMDCVRQDLGENQFPVAISPDFAYMVLLHRDDRDYGSYQLYDVKNRTSTLLLASEIPKKDVGHTYPFSFKTSDGQTVFGYLTLPPGKSPRNLPLMINTHGGPQARYVWTPNEYALLAANYGVAVLSVDFRFSLGYGNEYTDAASKNMFLVQQDVFESVAWAKHNGIADPAWIGIMGHSYGGFISFYQAAVHPDTYKTAVALMGVWDWSDLGDELIGDEPVPDYHKCSAPEPHTELARTLSPSSYADTLKCPVLIIYSGQDDAVYPSQNIRAIKDLTEAGNTPEVLYLPNIGHTPDTAESIIKVFETIKCFLMTQRT